MYVQTGAQSSLVKCALTTRRPRPSPVQFLRYQVTHKSKGKQDSKLNSFLGSINVIVMANSGAGVGSERLSSLVLVNL